MKKKNPSNANDVYSKQQSKELKRIRQFVKKANERGYIFFDNKVKKDGSVPATASYFDLPNSVKNPTKVTVNRLKKITKEYLYERAIYVDPETGSVHSGIEGRRIERSRAAKKGAETRNRNRIPPPDVILNLDILDTISALLNDIDISANGKPALAEYKEQQVGSLSKLFEDAIMYHELNGDIYEYASHLENNASSINHHLDSAMKASDQETVDLNVGAIATILNRGPLSPEQADEFSGMSENISTI